jgi:hypothetical protein
VLLEGLRGQYSTVERLDQYLTWRVPEVVRQHKRARQTPYTIAEPVTKSHLILVPRYAKLADIATLKNDAYRALVEENIELAEQLWIRVLAAASGRDMEAVKALQKIERLRVEGSEITAPLDSTNQLLDDKPLTLTLPSKREQIEPNVKPKSSTSNTKSRKGVGNAKVQFEEVLEFADAAFSSKTLGTPLSEKQRAILEGAWYGWTYQQIADAKKYDVLALERTFAPRLWKTLSEAWRQNLKNIGHKTVNKQNFRRVGTELIQRKSSRSSSSAKRSSVNQDSPEVLTSSEPVIEPVRADLSIKPQNLISHLGYVQAQDYTQSLTSKPQKWKCVTTFEGHTGWVNSVAISADGQVIASGSQDRAVKVWDLNTGQLLRTLGNWLGNRHEKSVYSVAISPDVTAHSKNQGLLRTR